MITVICTTNRPNSNTMKVALEYTRLLQHSGADAQVMDIGDVKPQWIQDSSFGASTPEMEAIVSKYVRKANKLVFIVPEYNGSFPGIIKYFMDACDHGEWANKKVAMVGVASGRSGNLRGLDQLTGIFHYLGSAVFWKKVYISQVGQTMDTAGTLTDEVALRELNQQINGFLSY